MKNPRYYILTIAVLLLSVLTACRKELCYDHFTTANIQFEYDKAWERDYGMNHIGTWDASVHGFGYDAIRPGTPEWVNVLRYNDTDRPGEAFLEPHGGNIYMNNKNEAMLFYNGDTEYIVFSDIATLPDARASATLRSRASISYVMQRHPNSRTTNPPDILYAAYLDKLTDVNMHEVTPVPVKMQPLVYTYIIRYEFEYGIDEVAYATGALGGMAESVYLRDGSTSESTSIILYDCDVKDYGCEAHVRSFGKPGFKDDNYGREASAAVDDRPYTLNLELKLKNGNTVEYNYDISDQLANQPRGGVIRITGVRVEDKDSRLPMDVDIDVSEWGNHVEIDIPIDE